MIPFSTIRKRKDVYIIGKGLIVHEDGRVLLVRRERPHHKDTHNRWEIAGGKLEFEEDIRECIAREVLEETGLVVEVDKNPLDVQVQYCQFSDRVSQNILVCYTCKVKSGMIKLGDKNINDIQWFSMAKLNKLNGCMQGTKQFIDKYKKLQKKTGKK